MRIVLFIPTASVEGDRPSAWLVERLDAAIEYYNDHPSDACVFVLSGRWKNNTDLFTFTEAEVAKRCILATLPHATIFKEEISVETGGTFAFSKPIIDALHPDRVCIFNSRVNEERIRFFADKIFGTQWKCEFIFLDDVLSQNERAQRKEPKALAMFQELFHDVHDGDDVKARDILLYQTPFYFKEFIDDKVFFDRFWPGGYEDFLEKRLSIENK